MDYTVPPPDEALLAATWERIRPSALQRMSLAEALRHPIYSVILKAAARGRPTPPPKPAPAHMPQPPTEPDLFSQA